MSLLSQFFPSGAKSSYIGNTSSGIAVSFTDSKQLPVDVLVIGGGGGGGKVSSTSPTVDCFLMSTACAQSTGGGGGGRVVTYTNAIVNTGVAYPITVGAGGASGAAGGSSCFGILIAGGGGSGAGTDPLGNPVASTVSSLGWGGNGGGAAGADATYIPEGNSGVYQSNNSLSSFIPGQITSPTTNGLCGYSCSTFCVCRFGGAGGTLSTCSVAPFFSKWGLPSFVDTSTGGSGTGLSAGGASSGLFSYSAPSMTVSAPNVTTFLYNTPIDAINCSTPNWYLDWNSIVFSRSVCLCTPSIIPLGTNCSLPWANQVATSIPITNVTAPIAFSSNYTLRFDVPGTMGPIYTACYPWVVNNWISSSMDHTGKVTTYCSQISNGSPGTGSGGSGGLRVQPATPIACQVTFTAPVLFCKPAGAACPSIISVTCPYGVSFPGFSQSGGAGGSGSVWVIYPTDYAAATVTGNTPVPSPPAIRVYRWDGAGTITFN